MTISVSESKWRSPKRAQISTCAYRRDITSLRDYSVVGECQHHPWRNVDLSKQFIFVWYRWCIGTIPWLVNTQYSALVWAHLFIDDSNNSEVNNLLLMLDNRFSVKFNKWEEQSDTLLRTKGEINVKDRHPIWVGYFQIENFNYLNWLKSIFFIIHTWAKMPSILNL